MLTKRDETPMAQIVPGIEHLKKAKKLGFQNIHQNNFAKTTF
jgi:hypothetical protein